MEARSHVVVSEVPRKAPCHRGGRRPEKKEKKKKEKEKDRRTEKMRARWPAADAGQTQGTPPHRFGDRHKMDATTHRKKP